MIFKRIGAGGCRPDDFGSVTTTPGSSGRHAPALILFLALVAAGPATTDYTDPQDRFSLTYPSDWTVVDPPAAGQVFSLRAPEPTPTTAPATTAPSKNFCILGVHVQDDPQAQSDRQTLMDVSAAVVDVVSHHGGGKVFIKPDTVGGLPARRVRFQTPPEDGGRSAVCIVVVKNHRAFVITAAGPADQFDAFLPKVEAALKTFKPGD